MKHSFELIDGRIYLVLTTQVWGSDIVDKRDVTDELKPVFNDMIDISFNGLGYKIIDNVLTYVGEDKDRYQK
jgi:hypothetical protein